MISTDNNCDDANLASRILGALSTSAEPDSLLWNTIVLAVRKFNWSNLRTNVSSLLCDESRKKGHTRRSRISLTVFLNRVDFCIKLTATESNFALKCISHSIDDLAGSDYSHVFHVSYGIENFSEMKKLDSMVEEHGWKATKEVVKPSLEFFSSNAPDRIEYFTCVGRLVSKFHGNHSCNITLDAMTTFASTFSSKMQKIPDYSLRGSLLSSSLAESLMISIRVVIEHREQSDMDSVGKKVISHRNTFSSFLKRASEISNDSIVPQTFLLDLLNKVFMQQSIEIDTEVPCTCSRGARSSCECTNPKAAVVRDPLTGLYPFMLAGSSGNTAAAFELLLSDPNLVLGGIPADKDEEENDRKRKRSPSM